jgi:chromosome segregation ATPase
LNFKCQDGGKGRLYRDGHPGARTNNTLAYSVRFRIPGFKPKNKRRSKLMMNQGGQVQSNQTNQINQNVITRLNNLKTQIDQGKNEKARAEANKEAYEKQKQEIISQLAELQVAPENLDAEIARLDTEIQQGLAKAEQLLNPQPTAQPVTQQIPGAVDHGEDEDDILDKRLAELAEKEKIAEQRLARLEGRA